MKIDFLASLPHFADHLAPVWHALTPDERGAFHCPPSLRATMKRHGIAPQVTSGRLEPTPNPVVVASSHDMERARGARRPVIFMEHGAGQSYVGVTSTSYIGSTDRRGCLAVLVPSEAAAERQRAATPDIPVHVVGCPKLDGWIDTTTGNDHPIPAFTHHWDCKVVPETRSGWPVYRDTYPAVAARWPDAIMHAHPRTFERQRHTLNRSKMRVVDTFAEVLASADLLVADNTSAIFEFAATGRPVVLLDLPWYRHDVHHGGRFWEWADIGYRCGRPQDLISTIEAALADPPPVAASRREIVGMVYAHLGEATPRTVEVIRSITQGAT